MAGWQSVVNSLKDGVLELRFVRRTNRHGHKAGEIRYMLCTKCEDVLDTPMGKLNLHFRRPVSSEHIDERHYNVAVVWDIMKADYRVIPCESIQVLRFMSPDDFWKEYDNVYSGMTSAQMNKFMYGK